MEEIEIKKWIISINNKKHRERAQLIGIDEQGNEYTFEYRDSSGNLVIPDIIQTRSI